MRRNVTYMLGASLAMLSITAPTTLAAQESEPPANAGRSVALSPDQQAVFDSWPPDQQFAYGTWPDATKNYYWSLSEERQKLFWRLSDDDKIAITAMSGEEQEAVWKNLEERSKAQPSEDAPPVM